MPAGGVPTAATAAIFCSEVVGLVLDTPVLLELAPPRPEMGIPKESSVGAPSKQGPPWTRGAATNRGVGPVGFVWGG